MSPPKHGSSPDLRRACIDSTGPVSDVRGTRSPPPARGSGPDETKRVNPGAHNNRNSSGGPRPKKAPANSQGANPQGGAKFSPQNRRPQGGGGGAKSPPGAGLVTRDRADHFVPQKSPSHTFFASSCTCTIALLGLHREEKTVLSHVPTRFPQLRKSTEFLSGRGTGGAV